MVFTVAVGVAETSGVRTGGRVSGVKTPLIDDRKKLKTALFGPISVSAYRD